MAVAILLIMIKDIIRMDDEGNIIWEKEIQIGNDGISDYYLDIGSSMIQTSQGDLVVLAPGAHWQ